MRAAGSILIGLLCLSVAKPRLAFSNRHHPCSLYQKKVLGLPWRTVPHFVPLSAQLGFRNAS